MRLEFPSPPPNDFLDPPVSPVPSSRPPNHMIPEVRHFGRLHQLVPRPGPNGAPFPLVKFPSQIGNPGPAYAAPIDWLRVDMCAPWIRTLVDLSLGPWVDPGGNNGICPNKLPICTDFLQKEYCAIHDLDSTCPCPQTVGLDPALV